MIAGSTSVRTNEQMRYIRIQRSAIKWKSERSPIRPHQRSRQNSRKSRSPTEVSPRHRTDQAVTPKRSRAVGGRSFIMIDSLVMKARTTSLANFEALSAREAKFVLSEDQSEPPRLR